MNLRQYILLNEQEENSKEIYDYIRKNYSTKEVKNMIIKKALEGKIIPSNWESEADSKEEWYREHGQNKAEDKVFDEIINKVALEKKVDLSKKKLDVMNWMYNVYVF